MVASVGLIKTRPKVRVQVPAEIRAGDQVRANVRLDCKRAVPVDWVDLTLTGIERWVVGGGKHTVAEQRTLCRLKARLCEERELPAGMTDLPVSIPLPADLPPSFKGERAFISYTLTVHASVPWWPDRRASFEILVVPPPQPSPPNEPRRYSTDPDGPVGTEPHVEMSLSTDWTRAGDRVTGALALQNTEHNRYSEISVALVGTLQYFRGASSYATREYLRYQIRLGAERATDGEMIPFRFRLPDDTAPDLPARPRPGGLRGVIELDWSFELTVGVRWGNDVKLRVPFKVLPRSERSTDAPSRLAPPAIGSDRLRDLWTSIGEPLGLRYEMQQLTTQLGDTELRIRRDHLGRDGIHLVVELSYPELHLGLEVEPATRVQRLVGGGTQIGVSGWDKEHYVRARDEAQVAEVLRALVPEMNNARLRRMDDTRLVVQVRDGGSSGARLERFARGAMGLGRALERVRAAMPPPSALAGVVDEWQTLADRLGAPLELARMRIAGTVGVAPAEVRVAFDEDGEPFCTWLSVEATTPLDEAHRFRLLARDDDPRARIAQRFEGDAVGLLETLAHGASEIEITPERITAQLPAPMGLTRQPPWIQIREQTPKAKPDAASVEQRLGRLAQLAQILKGQAGPYR